MIPCIKQLFLKKDARDSILGCGTDQLSHSGAQRCTEIIYLLDYPVTVLVSIPFRGMGQLFLGFGRVELELDIPTDPVVWHRKCAPL